MVNNTSDYLSKIIEFNNDLEIIELRDQYNEPSFFEVISKDRSETVYSSFLKWVFQDCAVAKGTISPILQLLNILVKRDQEQKDGREYNGQKIILIKDNLRDAILSGSVQIKTINVDTELSIAEYIERWYEEGRNLQLSPEKEPFIIKNADEDNRKKKLDIFIDCDVEIKDSNYQRLQIIIENKIDSREGENQTICYYESTKRQEEDNILQLYVYLSPLTSNKLTKLYQKKECEPTKKKDPNEKLRCESKHFIHINYQDILDSIITPLLASNSISSRSRFFLDEFKKQLSFPNLETGQSSIAIGSETVKQFTEIQEKYNQLIRDAAIAYSGDKFYIEVNSERVVTSANRGKNPEISVGESNLLISFWEQNNKLLLSIMNGTQNNDNLKALVEKVSKKPKSKYKIYRENKLLNKKEEPVGNAIAAKIIIQACVDKLVEAGDEVTLDVLRKLIPRKVNPYYEQWHPNLFQHLFYEYKPQATGTKKDTIESGYVYDGQDSKPVVTKENTWDIDFNEEKKNKHIIFLTDSVEEKSIKTENKIIMLKMWQKSAVEELINHISGLKDNQGETLLPMLKIEEVANNRVINTWSSSKK